MSFGTGATQTGEDPTRHTTEDEGEGHEMGSRRGRGMGRDGGGLYEMVGMK